MAGVTEILHQRRDAINVSRHYAMQQAEYCRNLIFRGNKVPISEKLRGNAGAHGAVLFGVSWQLS